MPADRRVVNRLAELGQLYMRDDGDVVIPLTQEELGMLAGTSRVTVNQVLNDLQKADLVKLARGRITLRNPELLAARVR